MMSQYSHMSCGKSFLTLSGRRRICLLYMLTIIEVMLLVNVFGQLVSGDSISAANFLAVFDVS